MKLGEPTRIEIHSGPDSLGRYSYTLFWMADYHPGHPDGEHRIAERGQCFFAPLRKKHDHLPWKRTDVR
jgi:hypothetical protein